MTKRPNVLLLISHDTGRYLGCYGKRVRTPNLDRLAEAGVRFEQAFCTAPQCSPSRAGLQTGRMPHSNGMLGLAHLGDWRIRRDIVTLPEAFANAGYESALIGFEHEGVDEVCRNGYERIMKTPGGDANDVAEASVRYLEERASARDGKPFYACVGFWETHRPYEMYESTPPAEVEVPAYLPDRSAIREDLGQLEGSLQTLDRGIGRIWEAVERLKLAENTLVVFTTDHGIAFPRAKGTLYDPGLEVSLLMSWKGTILPGQTSRGLISNIDLFPTLCDAAAIEAPEGIEGVSFWPLLRDEGTRQLSRSSLFCEMTWHDAYAPVRGVRTNRWKYIRHFRNGPSVYLPLDIHVSRSGQAVRDSYYASDHPAEEFYDLEKDPWERVNQADSPAYKETVREMRAALLAWMERTADPLLAGDVPGIEAQGWEEEKRWTPN